MHTPTLLSTEALMHKGAVEVGSNITWALVSWIDDLPAVEIAELIDVRGLVTGRAIGTRGIYMTSTGFDDTEARVDTFAVLVSKLSTARME